MDKIIRRFCSLSVTEYRCDFCSFLRFDLYLVVYVVALLSSIPTIMINILILFVMRKYVSKLVGDFCKLCTHFNHNSRLNETNKPLRIVIFLTIADLLHAVAVFPYIIYLISKWDRTTINMNPYTIMISSAPLILHLKTNLVLTIFIALDRTLALYIPFRYRRISPSKFGNAALFIGIVIGVFDLIIEFKLSSFVEVPNCGAVGCFVSLSFRTYWGLSNMALSITAIILTILVMVKLHCLRINSNSLPKSQNCRNDKLFKASCSSLLFLLCSLLFLTTPSVVVAVTELFGVTFFRFIGPLNLAGLLSAGQQQLILFDYFTVRKKHNAESRC
ncbi:hypothetical protein DICVIV_02954 [Dictyocaulus viviparus]|uniref:G-protein coupled receptors family 1 profile domain-containing protein n=1 Tax=Dictyocaulus viviparus TaxID=29172 RepID=A0A0D8Y2G8_DICVI|nr:hypothetical protein DICVIV_02954 [Dictyocaulus viviparus]